MDKANFHAQMAELVSHLISTIGDDYRSMDYDASQSPDEDVPSMSLTIGADADSWSFQTGDNSFTGGAYSYPDWAVVTLTRESKPEEVATEIVDQFVNDTDMDIFGEDDAEPEHDGQPDEAQEWHDFDPDC